MKQLALIALVAAAAPGATVFTADFTGSTADTANTSSPSGNTVTTVANLDAGTTTGSWETPTTSVAGASTQSSQVLVSSGTATGMTGNFLLIGASGNTDPFGSTDNHHSVATLNLSSAVSLNGAILSFGANMFGSGGQPGGLWVTGKTTGGDALFTIVCGNGGSYGQKDLSTASDASGTLNETHNDLWTTNGDGKALALTLGASSYTLTGDGGTTNLAGSYFTTGDLASIEFHAIDSKAQWGIDDITVTGVPEPATMSLLALGGIAMLRRRKK